MSPGCQHGGEAPGLGVGVGEVTLEVGMSPQASQVLEKPLSPFIRRLHGHSPVQSHNPGT